LRERVGGVQVQRAAKVGQGFGRFAGLQFLVSTRDVGINQLLPGQLACGQVFHVAWNQLGGSIQFTIGLLEVIFLELQPMGECGLGLFQVVV